MKEFIKGSAVLSLGALMVLLLATAPSFAQTGGVLTGRVSDASGALIPGVDITISSQAMPAGDRGAISNESGVYRFTGLNPGSYRVEFALPGFATRVNEAIPITAGFTYTLNAEMEVATVAETITVTGDAPAVDLESASIQTNWDESLLEDIPSGRTLRALMTEVPGFYSRAIDVGGSGTGTGTQGSYRAYGDSSRAYFLTDGVYTGGHYSAFGAYQEIQIVAAAKGADVPTPGVYFNAVIRSGSNDVHGFVYTDYENADMQANNVTEALKAKGLQGRKFSRFQSFDAEIGGPIIKNRAWYYISHYDVYNGEPVAGLTDEAGNKVDYYTRLADPTYKFTFQITDNNKIDTMGQFGWKHQPYRSANQYRPAEAARDQASWSMVGNVKWQSILSPTATLDMQLSRWGYWWPSYARVRNVPYTQDLTTGYVRGSLSENYSKPTRWQWNTNLAIFTDAGQGDHEFKIGWGGWFYHYQNTIYGYSGHQQYFYRSQGNEADAKAGWPEAMAFFTGPERVTVQNTPYRYDDNGIHHNFFINDRWNIAPGFTFTWGLRFDRYDSWYPAQGNKGTGPYATKFTIPRRDFDAMSNWVPRLAFVYDLTGDGTIALKGSYGRYYGDPGRSPASSVNPGSQGGATKTYCAIKSCASDVPASAAWDGTIPYVPNELALISTSGGRDRGVLGKIKNNYLDEVTLGLDFALGDNYTARVNVVRKWDRQGRLTLNTMLPYEAYTDSIERTDPSDGRKYVIWSVPKSYPGYGKRVDRMQMVDGANHNSYLGWEATLNKRMSNNYQFMATFSSDYRQERCNRESFSVFSGYNCSGSVPLNPNQALYDPSLRRWEWSGKLMGIYELPHGFMFSGILKSQSGQHYGRELRLRDRNNRTVPIFVDHAKWQMPSLHLLDLRLAKEFEMSDRYKIEAMFDLFNVNNSSAVVAMSLRTGPSFQRPSKIPPGRILRLGAKFTF